MKKSVLSLSAHYLFIFLQLLLLALTVAPAHSFESTLLLSDSQMHSLDGHLEILVDKSNDLSFENILAPPNQNRFRPIPGFISQGYTADVVWARLSVRRSANFPENSFLRLWPSYLDFIDVYIQNGDDPADPAMYLHYRLGDHIPVAERPVIDTDFAVPLHLPDNKKRRLYLSVRTSSSLNLSGAIHTPTDYITYGSFNVARHAGYLAITLVIAMINLILYIRLRDRLYLYFSLYVFCLFTFTLPTSGLMTLIFPSLVHILSDYLVGIGVGCALFFFSLFGMRLFENSMRPWVWRCLVLISMVALLTAFSPFIGFYSRMAPIMFICSILNIFILTFLSIREVTKKTEGAVVYLLAFGISNIGYTAQFLRLIGIFPIAWWNTHAIEIASIVNMVFMTLAMTERVNRAEERALQAALQAEHKAVELAKEMTSDLQEKQAALEENLERKARFVEMVSHEYRTPLAIISANLDILELREVNHEKIPADNIVKMRRATARLVEVIETSLLRSNLQSGELNQKFELVDAADFLVTTRDEARGLWPGSALVITLKDLPTAYIMAEPALLKTALLNLIDNAVKYAANAGPIALTLGVSGKEVRIGVMDLGPGIPEHERMAVCDKYHRGDSSSGKTGKGLGLYLVTKILEEHGGRLELSANHPKGTVATLVLHLVE